MINPHLVESHKTQSQKVHSLKLSISNSGQCEALFRQARGAKSRSATQARLVLLAPQYGAKHLNRVRSTQAGPKAHKHSLKQSTQV